MTPSTTPAPGSKTPSDTAGSNRSAGAGETQTSADQGIPGAGDGDWPSFGGIERNIRWDPEAGQMVAVSRDYVLPV
jgi:hypothetical protein